jgi:hypothetical protein
MNHQSRSDPQFDDRGRKPWRPIRSIGLLMLLVALSALLLSAALETQRKPPPVIAAPFPAVAVPAVLVYPTSRPVPAPDPFARVADASIDPQFVVPAPPDLDDAMVVNPEAPASHTPPH